MGGLSVVEQHSPVQLFAGFLICFGYLLLVLRASPYRDDDLDRLSFFTSLSMCLTLLFGLLKSMDEHRAENEYSDTPWEIPEALFSTVLVCLNSLPFAFAGTSTILRWWGHRKEILAELEKDLTMVLPIGHHTQDEQQEDSEKDGDSGSGTGSTQSEKEALRDWRT